VTNIGSFDVTGVHIVDAEATVSTVEDLPTGTSATFMSEEMIASGLFSNTAYSAGEFIFGNVVSNTTGAIVDTVAPELEVVKTASRSGDCADSDASISALSNDLITWCYTVNNLGDTDLTGVVLSSAEVSTRSAEVGTAQIVSDMSSRLMRWLRLSVACCFRPERTFKADHLSRGAMGIVRRVC
jgi:hypothetical protein